MSHTATSSAVADNVYVFTSAKGGQGSGVQTNADAGEAQIEWMRSTARVKEELPPRILFLGTDFYQGSRIYIDGYSGAGKSMLLLGIAQAIATGSPFCGWHRGHKPSVVLFLQFLPAHLIVQSASSSSNIRTCSRSVLTIRSWTATTKVPVPPRPNG